MARPKKVKVDIMDGTEMIEIKDEGKTYVANPTGTMNNPAVEDVEIVPAVPVEDVTPQLTVEVMKPKKVEEDKTQMPPPIYDIVGLTEDDKQVLVEKRIKAIISQTQIPYIPALIRFREPGTTAVPPMYALVDFDHRFVDEGWQFYKTNVRDPYAKDYLNLIVKVMNKPNKIFTRVVQFNYE